METKETDEAGLAGVGQKLLAHSKAAEFSAKRGLVVELFPFIYGASERMSSRAISQFLEKEQGIKLSSVTINKALKDPAKNWNLFFDLIEPAARTYAKADGVQMKDMLFKKKIFFKPVQNRVVQAAIKVLVNEDVVQAVRILRTKWETIDLEIRQKSQPYIEHRLGK